MEKPKGRNFNMRSHFCMPRMKGSSNWTRKTSRPTYPISLLDRLREAVFRLIMFSALSKATTTTTSSSSSSRSSRRESRGFPNVQKFYHSYDPHHSEAVADCIEFIKKSAVNEECRPSTACSSIDGGSEVAVPVHFV